MTIIGNRTHDLPVCSAVPQTPALPQPPHPPAHQPIFRVEGLKYRVSGCLQNVNTYLQNRTAAHYVIGLKYSAKRTENSMSLSLYLFNDFYYQNRMTQRTLFSIPRAQQSDQPGSELSLDTN